MLCTVKYLIVRGNVVGAVPILLAEDVKRQMNPKDWPGARIDV